MIDTASCINMYRFIIFWNCETLTNNSVTWLHNIIIVIRQVNVNHLVGSFTSRTGHFEHVQSWITWCRAVYSQPEVDPSRVRKAISLTYEIMTLAAASCLTLANDMRRDSLSISTRDRWLFTWQHVSSLWCFILYLCVSVYRLSIYDFDAVEALMIYHAGQKPNRLQCFSRWWNFSLIVGWNQVLKWPKAQTAQHGPGTGSIFSHFNSARQYHSFIK